MRSVAAAVAALAILAIAIIAGDRLASRAARDIVTVRAQAAAELWASQFEGPDGGFAAPTAGVAPEERPRALVEEGTFIDVVRFAIFDREGRLVHDSDDPDAPGAGVDRIAEVDETALAVARSREPDTRLANVSTRADLAIIHARSYLPIIRAHRVEGVIAAEINVTDDHVVTVSAFETYGRAVGALLAAAVAVPAAMLVALLAKLRRRARALASARDRARSAERAKSVFLSNMSHEVLSPLHGALGAAELLGETRLDEEQRGYLGIVTGSSEALLRVVGDILDFSDAESGETERNLEAYDLHAMLDDVVELFRRSAAEKDLELCVDCAIPAPAWFVGDAPRLRRCLRSLMSNAVKFTASGHVALAVEEEEDALVFSVADTGVGIAPEHMRRVFAAFEQVESGDVRRYDGMGLGLPITRRLARLMGGEVTATSEPGCGSRFELRTPRREARSIPSAPAPAPDVLRNLRALIVDDLEVNRRILAARLERWGMTVAVADDAAEAEAFVRSCAASGRRIDVALLDQRMPDRSGVELFRALRSDPALPRIPTLILSSSGADARAAALEAGVEAVLGKPASAARLHAAIAGALGLGDAEVAHPERDGEGFDAAPPSLAGLRVLVAEDNEVNRMVMDGMLAPLGASVEMVENGRDALAAYRAAPHDVVLMDVSMPGGNGLDATRAIRAFERERGLAARPILALTANVLQEDRDRCLAAGMSAFLGKPVRRASLYAALSAVVGAQARASAPEAETA